jgi:glycosyltransferase involved in cell wall biosynthesis
LRLPIKVYTLLPGAPGLVRSFDPDVVFLTHDRWFLPNLQLAMAAGDRPIVASPFSHPYKGNALNWIQTFCIRQTLRRASFVHAVTQHEAQHLRAMYGVPDARISVFPQGVRDFAISGPRPRERRDVVLFVGRLDAVKGPLVAARAFCTAAPSLPASCRFVAVGADWGELSGMRAVFRDAAIEDRFVYRPYIDRSELAELYDRAIVVVLPSQVGAFGYPIFEAFARGTPVVTASTPQSVELVSAGATLVAQPDAHAYADGIRRYAADVAFWTESSRAAFDLATRQFDATSMVSRLRALFVEAGAPEDEPDLPMAGGSPAPNR